MKKKLLSIFLLMAMVLVFCCCSIPVQAAADEGCMVFITKPADGATVTAGEDVPLYCTMTLPDDWNAQILAALYYQLTVQVLQGNTVISSDTINTSQAVFNGVDRKYYTLRFSAAGTYTVRVSCMGLPDIWYSITVHVVEPGTSEPEPSVPDLPTGNYPIGTDPKSGMNSYEIPGFVSEENNPGHHLRLSTNEVTIDLSKDKIGRFSYVTDTEATDFVFYVDWSEDQKKNIIKFHDIGDDWIEYEGVSEGTTRLHTYIMVDLTRYDHQVVTFHVIDSSKPAAGQSGDNSTSSNPSGIQNSTGTSLNPDGTAQTPTESAGLVPGTMFSDKSVNGVFQVNSDGNTVTFVKPASKNKSSVTIPDTLNVNGTACAVTEIAAKAFKGNKKLTKLTIGINVSRIGAQAFYGCRNLKKIIIRSRLLTKKTIGSKAFRGIANKAAISVPKVMLKSYKTILKAKGISKKASFKKQ